MTLNSDLGAPHHLVVFTLQDHSYALPLERVDEVIRAVAITPVADGPEWLRGVINVRGNVIPVTDLRARLGLEIGELTLDARIVLAHTSRRPVGLIVDAAGEVLTVPTESSGGARGLAGGTAVVRVDDRLITILDLDHLFGQWVESPLQQDGG